MRIGQTVRYYGQLARVERILSATQPMMARIILIPEGFRTVALLDERPQAVGLIAADPIAYDVNLAAEFEEADGFHIVHDDDPAEMFEAGFTEY